VDYSGHLTSPLRTEAENWFLMELRGRYDVVLKFIARHNGCLHSDIPVNPLDGADTSAVSRIWHEFKKIVFF
jgi:hypothetical protein